MRWVIGVAAAAAAVGASARAGDEVKCAAQYGFQEQMILEWAAIGGDPNAQYAMAQCAFPRGASDLTSAEKTSAAKWVMLADCEATGLDDYETRDRMTRALKYGGNISFRRFGGITEDETWTAREKRLIEMRDAARGDLKSRVDDLQKATSPAERDAARAQLIAEFSKMGPLGLARLADISSCKSLGASKVEVAALWSAAADAWSSSQVDAIYGDDQGRAEELKREADKRFGKLSKSEKREFAAVKNRVANDDSERIARLESDAALGRIQNLGFASAGPEGLQFTGSATPTAVQYALESLGFIEFVNGPDNDYGPSTIEAAKRAQAAYGRPETRWLAPGEVRQVVCDAALKKDDPVSYYHVAMMYAEGSGFPKNLPLAREALAKAEKAMSEQASKASALPEWKQRAYPEYAERIKVAKAAFDAASAAAPVPVHAVPVEGTLCQ